MKNGKKGDVFWISCVSISK